jgi:hypothetical protein
MVEKSRPQMNCTQIEKLIPLYVGGDLKPPEIDEVRRHSELCVFCRELIAEFDESQSWLRGFVAPQFDETVFDDLRDAVRREITRTEMRPAFIGSFEPFWNLRFVIGGSLALIFLTAGLAFFSSQTTSSNRNPIAVADDNDKGARVDDPPQINQTIAPRSGQKHNAIGRTNRTGGHAARLRPGRRNTRQNADIAVNQPMNEDGDSEMLRIEIQTADPNIRIIWLAPKDSHPSSTRHDSDYR